MYKKMYLFEVKNAFDHVLKTKNGEYLAYNLGNLLEDLGQYMGVEDQFLYNAIVELIESGKTTLYDHVYILKEKEFRAEAIAALKQEAKEIKKQEQLDFIDELDDMIENYINKRSKTSYIVSPEENIKFERIYHKIVYISEKL